MLTPSKVGFCIALTIAVSSALLHAEGATGPARARGAPRSNQSDYDTARKTLQGSVASGKKRGPARRRARRAFRVQLATGRYAESRQKRGRAGKPKKGPAPRLRRCTPRRYRGKGKLGESGVDPGGGEGGSRARDCVRVLLGELATSPRDGARARKTR